MSNLLVTEDKKNIDISARARGIFAGAVVLIVGGIIACLALTPALISISVARASLDASGAEEENAREDQTVARQAQSLVTALKPLTSATTTPSDMLAAALTLKPEDVSVTAVTYSAPQKEIVLSGASTREAVNAYREALEASGMFATVAVPVAALIGAEGGRFTITLTGN